MNPRRRSLNHNKDIRILERDLQKSARERQDIMPARRPPDIQKRLDEIKNAKKKDPSTLNKDIPVKVNQKPIDLDTNLLGEIQKNYHVNTRNPKKKEKGFISLDQAVAEKPPTVEEIEDPQPKPDLAPESDLAPEEEKVEPKDLIIVELAEDLLLSKNNSTMTKYRDLKTGERGLYLRDATEKELEVAEEACVLVEFEDPVFVAALYPEKDGKQYLIPKEKLTFITPPKAVSNKISVEDLRDFYRERGESLTSIGLLDFSDEFLIFAFDNDLTTFLYAFVDYLAEEEKDPNLFNPKGFLKLLDNKPWLKPDELDRLLCDFINSNRKAKEWFKSLQT